MGPRDYTCIWLILNEALAHYNKTVGCYIEANVKDGGMQKFDSIHLHSDSLMSCPPALNLKVGKMNHGLGNQAPEWAKLSICSKSGQNVSGSGRKSIHIRLWHSTDMYQTFWLHKVDTGL